MRSVKFRNLEFWKGGVAGSVKLISRKGIRMVNGCGMQLGRNWFPSWRRRDGLERVHMELDKVLRKIRNEAKFGRALHIQV
ncbi:uncharacterized protein LOC121052711 isoform X3 [Rosa chinensis]|uniref:uncharacterized protein LOC121052711 isoform X3 n=1 Tax=Rosa chinensis TaxID=74649 RepID=UPI001AD9496E|nr:uncharacterized protein LOC121052711 isoform X3 [Rosa chinensis]